MTLEYTRVRNGMSEEIKEWSIAEFSENLQALINMAQTSESKWTLTFKIHDGKNCTERIEFTPDSLVDKAIVMLTEEDVEEIRAEVEKTKHLSDEEWWIHVQKEHHNKTREVKE